MYDAVHSARVEQQTVRNDVYMLCSTEQEVADVHCAMLCDAVQAARSGQRMMCNAVICCARVQCNKLQMCNVVQ